MRDRLAGVEDRLAPLAESFPPLIGGSGDDANTGMRLKKEDEYFAIIMAGRQRRTRNHERLIRLAAEILQRTSCSVQTMHPFDMIMTKPLHIFSKQRWFAIATPDSAMREAVGQLFEYRYFRRPTCDHLCILLDARPDERLVKYVEDSLGLLMIWLECGELRAGPRSREILGTAGVQG